MSPITERNGEMMRRGRIEVICGSMFSGKTEELIRRLKRAEFARQSVEIFKPSIAHAMPNKTWCRTKETPFPPPP